MESKLSDEELIERSRKWISDLCQRQKGWIMSIPARVDHDPDLLWSECLDRLKKYSEAQSGREK